jgi:hypothetical protein
LFTAYIFKLIYTAFIIITLIKVVIKMTNNEAVKCMNAFNAICDEADRSELVSSEDCNYWVFERGYQAAMQELAMAAKIKEVQKPTDFASQMLANGFALLEEFGPGKKKFASSAH